MTQNAARHPILFSIITVFVALIIVALLGDGLAALKLSEYAYRLIVEIVFCGYVAYLLTRLGWWREAGFTRPASLRRLLACLPLLFLPLVVLLTSGIKAVSPGRVAWFALFTLAVGFAEEGMLRGVVLRAVLPGGLTRAVLLSSLLFGIGHLINLAQGGPPAFTIVQIIYAALLGIGFAGVRLYTRSIWPVMLVHTLIDFVDFGSRGFVLAVPQTLTLGSAIATIVITGLYALYGWWLLRRVPLDLTPATGAPPA